MNPDQAWQTVLGQLQMEMSKASFDTWIRDTRALDYDADTGVLTVGVRNGYARDWLESRLTRTVERLLIGIMDRPRVDVRFVVAEADGDEGELPDLADDETNESGDTTIEGVDPFDISPEDALLMGRTLVLHAYLQRLIPEIGVKGVFLYGAYKQAWYMAGDTRRGGVGEKYRIPSDEIIRWSIFSKGAYWRTLKSKLPLMAGLVEKVDAPGEWTYQNYRRDGRTLRRRMPVAYRVYLTPRLARVDAAFLYQRLKARMNEIMLLEALQELSRMERKEWLAVLPPLDQAPPPVDGLADMLFVTDIVRALLGEESELSGDIRQASIELNRIIINLFGTMHLSHYFLYRLIPAYRLTPHQAWLVAVARDRAYINERTGEMRSEVTFKGYAEMAALCGMSSWKGIAIWLKPDYKNRRGGDLSPFMQEIVAEEDSYESEGNRPRRFWVNLHDDSIPPEPRSGIKWGEQAESNGVNRRIKWGKQENQMGGTVESNGVNETTAPLKELIKITLTTKGGITETTANHAAKRRAAAAGHFSLQHLCQINRVSPKVQRELQGAKADVQALVSWVLWAVSLDGDGIEKPFNYALARLREDPTLGAGGAFDALAALPPAALRQLIQHTAKTQWSERAGTGNDIWDAAMGAVNERVGTLMPILFGEEAC